MQQMETAVAKEGVHTQCSSTAPLCSTVQILENFPFFGLCCPATRPVGTGPEAAQGGLVESFVSLVDVDTSIGKFVIRLFVKTGGGFSLIT